MSARRGSGCAWAVVLVLAGVVAGLAFALANGASVSLPLPAPVAEIANRLSPGIAKVEPTILLEDIDEDGLGFASLTDDQKILYQQMLDGVRAMEESITLTGGTEYDVEPTFHALMIDHPELFWLDGSTRFTYFEGGGTIHLTPGLCMDLEQVDEVRERIEEAADEFLSTIPAGADDFTKMRMAYEYVIDTTDYDVGVIQNQNIQSVFLYHASVCAGYSRAFQYLLQRAGVYCSFVEGRIPSTGEDHAWNIVRIGDDYTYVDVTWGDPTYPGLEDASLGTVYDYLGLTTDELLRDDHVFSDASMWPEAASPELNYYVRQGLMFSSADEGLLSASLWAQLEEGAYPVVFRFDNEAAYAAVRGQLATGEFLLDDIRQILMSQGTLSQGYQYSFSDALTIVKLFL